MNLLNDTINRNKYKHLNYVEKTQIKRQYNIDKKALNAKYLSDVSFSNNDYVLNTLLNLLPSKIYLHKVSPLSNLDFINTLQLIFENRIESCSDCNICNLYKKIKTGIKH